MERTAILLIAAVSVVGCSPASQSDPVAEGLRSALDCRGLHDVSIDQDVGTGRIVLRGEVPTDLDRAAAISVAHSVGPAQVAAAEVVVAAPGRQSDAARLPQLSLPSAPAPSQSPGASHRKRQPLEWQTWGE